MSEIRLFPFAYRAARRDGSIVRGSVLATDAERVRRLLDDSDLSLLDVRVAGDLAWQRPARRQDLAAMFRNLAILTESGVPLERALAASEPLVGERLRLATSSMRGLLREGCSLSDSMAALPRVFPRSVIGLMRAGERASKLSDACSSAADQLEHEAELEADIRSSLAYPVLILLVGLASVLVMGVVVIPRFAELIGDLGGEIPAGASLLIAASEFIASHGLAAGIGSGVLLAAFIRGLGAPGIRPRLDAALLRLPGVGGLRLAFASARTCRALGAMLSSGMPLLEALDATADAAGDLEVKRRFELARADVRGGRPLAASLADHRAVAPLALQLIGVGEASGRLAQMTRRAGDISAERARRALQAAVSLLEPLLVVVLGVLVAVVAAILLQAVYSVRAV